MEGCESTGSCAPSEVQTRPELNFPTAGPLPQGGQVQRTPDDVGDVILKCCLQHFVM
jgi:hypothetical protein